MNELDRTPAWREAIRDARTTDDPLCPDCGKMNVCREHRWANAKYARGLKAFMFREGPPT